MKLSLLIGLVILIIAIGGGRRSKWWPFRRPSRQMVAPSDSMSDADSSPTSSVADRSMDEVELYVEQHFYKPISLDDRLKLIRFIVKSRILDEELTFDGALRRLMLRSTAQSKSLIFDILLAEFLRRKRYVHGPWIAAVVVRLIERGWRDQLELFLEYAGSLTQHADFGYEADRVLGAAILTGDTDLLRLVLRSPSPFRAVRVRGRMVLGLLLKYIDRSRRSRSKMRSNLQTLMNRITDGIRLEAVVHALYTLQRFTELQLELSDFNALIRCVVYLSMGFRPTSFDKDKRTIAGREVSINTHELIKKLRLRRDDQWTLKKMVDTNDCEAVVDEILKARQRGFSLDDINSAKQKPHDVMDEPPSASYSRGRPVWKINVLGDVYKKNADDLDSIHLIV